MELSIMRMAHNNYVLVNSDIFFILSDCIFAVKMPWYSFRLTKNILDKSCKGLSIIVINLNEFWISNNYFHLLR